MSYHTVFDISMARLSLTLPVVLALALPSESGGTTRRTRQPEPAALEHAAPMRIRSFALVACLVVASPSLAATLDPRLSGFLETVIKDPATLAKEKDDYASRGVTLEAFIYAVYTRVVEFDNTPDNSMALAQLGQYLEEKRPGVSPQLLDQMTGFYTAKENQTMMRGMFLETVRGLVTGASPDSGAEDAKGAPSRSTLRHAGLESVALGQARLAAKGDLLAVMEIGHTGWDGVRILAPAGSSQVRVKVMVPGEKSLPPGAYLEILSRAAGAPADSFGYLRIERIPAGNAYEVSGAVAKVTSPVVVALRGGYEVRRDPLNNNGSAFARVNACLRCESSLNDALGAPGVVLRWQWSKPSIVTILNRAAGRDTTVTCDELRLIDPTPGNGDGSISELILRGRDLGEIRIRSDEAKVDKGRKK